MNLKGVNKSRQSYFDLRYEKIKDKNTLQKLLSFLTDTQITDDIEVNETIVKQNIDDLEDKVINYDELKEYAAKTNLIHYLPEEMGFRSLLQKGKTKFENGQRSPLSLKSTNGIMMSIQNLRNSLLKIVKKSLKINQL